MNTIGKGFSTNLRNGGYSLELHLRVLRSAAMFILKLAVLFVVFFVIVSSIGLIVFIIWPDLQLWAFAFFFIPWTWAGNRFVMSPIEYHIDLKTMQYDPWYENRIKAKRTAEKR